MMARDDEIGMLAMTLYNQQTPHGPNRSLGQHLIRALSGVDNAPTFLELEEDVQNYWRLIASSLMQHAKGWEKDSQGRCVLKSEEARRLALLPRV